MFEYEEEKKDSSTLNLSPYYHGAPKRSRFLQKIKKISKQHRNNPLAALKELLRNSKGIHKTFPTSGGRGYHINNTLFRIGILRIVIFLRISETCK